MRKERVLLLHSSNMMDVCVIGAYEKSKRQNIQLRLEVYPRDVTFIPPPISSRRLRPVVFLSHHWWQHAASKKQYK